MATYIEMPKLSDTMTEGTLVKWLKSEGGPCPPSTNRSPRSKPTRRPWRCNPSTRAFFTRSMSTKAKLVPLGAALALVLAEGEDPPENADTPPGVATPPTEADAGEESGESDAPAPRSENPASPPSESDAPVAPAGKIRVSPLAGRIAAEKGVDLSAIKGTGPGGRIVKKDVLAAAAAGVTAVSRGRAATEYAGRGRTRRPDHRPGRDAPPHRRTTARKQDNDAAFLPAHRRSTRRR